MTDNEIGYQIYLWEQRGYRFIPLKYSSEQDWTHYLDYYSDSKENEELRRRAIAGTLD